MPSKQRVAGSNPAGGARAHQLRVRAAVTNAVGKLEQRGLVRRSMSPDDRRVVIATITLAGRTLVDEATAALNDSSFGMPSITSAQAAEMTEVLRVVRATAGDL